MRIPKATTIFAVALTAVLAAPPVQGDGWDYDFGIYAFGTGTDGTVGVGPVEGEIDLSFSDILEELEFAAFLFFRAETDRWAVMTDIIFVDLAAGRPRFDADIGERIFELDLAYRLTEEVELLFGARYVDLDSDVALLGPLGLRAGGGESWVDPVVGVRFDSPIGEKWTTLGRVSAGGFGAGSDFSYQVALHFGYRLSQRSSLVFGWRHLDIDYDDGEGRDRFLYDVALTGPQLGILFHF